MEAAEAVIIGVVGGTGKLGKALARRWLEAGYTVHLGSRSADKAAAAARELRRETGLEPLWGSNPDVAAAAEMVVVTVPFAAQADTLHGIRDAVQGKIVVDTTVPLMPPKVMRVQLPSEGSAALRAQSILGEEVSLVSAFHNVAAHLLGSGGKVSCDIMVFGDNKSARARVVALAEGAGLRGIHAGPLVNAVAAEALTSVLIFVNKTYSIDGAGIQFTGELAGKAP